MVRSQPPNMGSSPPSSTEATFFGTPSTNITAMSPDECFPTGRSVVAPRYPMRISTQPAQSSFQASGARNTQLPAVGTAQLSPTAEEFTPRTATFAPSYFSHNADPRISPVRNLVAGSMPDVRTSAQPSTHGPVGQGSPVTVVRDVNSNLPLGPCVYLAYDCFSTDENVTRTFQIFDRNIPSVHQILNQFPSRFDTLTCIDSKHIQNGIVRLSFDDERDAKQAYVLAASLTHPHCELSQLTAKEVAVIHGKDPNIVSNYDGQLLVTILFNSRSVMPTVEQFHDKLAVFGDVKAIHTINPMIMSAITFRVEYHNVVQANEALKYLQQASYENVHFLVARYEPDLVNHPTVIPSPAIPISSSESHPSLTGRTTVPPGDYARLESVMARAMRENSTNSRGAARIGHNVVDIGRIRAGIDVRTTIMLRNIPNRVDQATLKGLLDETSFGEYDFMYLRIDFANNCNVGYAFINFVDPLAIIPFACARAGQRWNIFSSDKIAEISYATIQGRDCLIQKFRNSSVMLEHPSYCPKLYITRPSVFAGQEEPFPDPDNYSKMRRSIDNAEHIGLYRPAQGDRRQAAAPANVLAQQFIDSAQSNTSTPMSWSSSTTSSSTNSGLFAPREGQAHREEQRRRRSQYDRGTPGAEIELSSYRLTDAALDGPRNSAAHIAATLNGFNL